MPPPPPTSQVFQTKLGQFVASAGAATFGFWVVWPLEVLKVRDASERVSYMSCIR